jgi:general secretion pathway protein A
MDLYKTIAWEMGLPTERSRAALYRQLKNEVTRLCAEARCRPILIVDEAHNLRSEVLEDLRLLTNYQMDAENRLCLLLVGQAELRRRLGMAAYEALSQRIVVRYHVAGLGRSEIEPYLVHLLRLAGTELPLLEPAAIEAVFQATQGLPRKVNFLDALARGDLPSPEACKANHLCVHIHDLRAAIKDYRQLALNPEPEGDYLNF